MGMGKGGETKTSVKLPKELQDAAKANLAEAQRAAKLPYAPNMGLQVAAFTPMQQAAMKGTNDAASAFGMPTVNYGGPNTGMGLPPPQQAGGFSGYSPQGIYEDALAKMPPGVKALYETFFNTKKKDVNQPQATGTPLPTSGNTGTSWANNYLGNGRTSQPGYYL